MSRLLVFLRGEDDLAWVRLDDNGVIVARGASAPVAEPEERVIAVAPGEAVTLHWVEMPDLAPAQAMAAGRLAATDVCAAPLTAAHVAVGVRDEEGYYPLAVTDAGLVAGWLARCALAGLDPDVIAPAPLLLLPAEDGVVAAEAGELLLVRGSRLAFAAEPELAAMMIGEAVPAKVDSEAFEAGLADALDALPVNLRQGVFAKVKPWQVDGKRLRRIAGFAALAVLLMLLVSLAQLFRYNIAADIAETSVATEARALLPRDADLYDPVTQVRAHMAAQGGAGGFSATAAALFAVLRDTPGAEVSSLRYDPAGGLSVAVATAQGGDLQVIQDRLRAAGYEPTAGTLRNEAERAVTDISVRPR